MKILTDVEKGSYGNEHFISDYVFDETLTVMFSKCRDKEAVSKLGAHIIESFNIIHVDENTFLKAFELFSKNNKLSFTDCTLVVMANSYDISYIATRDKEFKKHFKNCVSD